MEFLKSLSIRTKLFLISVIPSLGLIYLLQNAIVQSLERKQTTLKVYENCEEVEKLSALIHEFQAERGLALLYIASNTEKDRNKVVQQERLTDLAANQVQSFYREHQMQHGIVLVLDSLIIFREDQASYPEKLNRIKSLVLAEISKVASRSDNTDIKNALEAHLSLLYAKDFFSRTKNILLPALEGNSFRRGEFAEFAEHKGQYEFSRERFLMRASEQLVEFYERAYSTKVIAEVHATLDSVLISGNPSGTVSSNDWWNKTNQVINALIKVETHSFDTIRQKAEAELAAINRDVITNVIAGFIILLLIAFAVSLTIRQILFAIAELKRAAHKLSQGEVDFTVNVTSGDEMADLAESFNKMVAVKKLYAQTAEKIGKGNYQTPVLVRTSSDILGIALSNMKSDLERLSRENEVRTWLLTGNSTLNDHIRGDKATPVLATEVITQLTEFLNAQIGALYVRENGHLRLAGRYAYQENGEDRIFTMGEGFIGQAAADGKRILFKDVPDDYIKVTSGLGDLKPKNILVYPFMYEGEVKGVAEIGAVKEFSALDLEFLDLVSNHIGIAINASQSRERLKHLLEQTQRQSEELEAQQEELKQFNEELLEKTRLLEKSEEELKSQQEELQLSNEELVEKAAILNEQKENLEFTKLQIEAKAHELELASQYKTEFLSNMSHELRTPLNSILILAQVLMENRNRTLSLKEIKFARTIYNSGNDLLKLIDEILDLSKIEAGKMELEVASFSIEILVQNLLNAFDQLAGSKRINFKIHCNNSVKVLISDQQRIEQILKNFLSNAFKFTSPGGTIELLIGEPGPGVVFRKKALHHVSDLISFTVSDTGIGIPEEKLSIIFDAFQQVDGSTKRKYGGTGLGLSISRELANLLGGEIHVESQVGTGSKFTLYLPAEKSERLNREMPENRVVFPSPVSHARLPSINEPVHLNDASRYDDQHLITEGDRKILIMEDDVNFSKVLLDFVHERNYKGIIAHHGNIGLSYARHYRPDAIILDMKLPGVDGAEVLKKLKSDPDLRHIPVQIISGFDFRKKGLELGAVDFIQKPISREAFWRALDKVEHIASRKPKKLLIVEDNQQQNLAVKELIGNGDVKCYSVHSGKEAYEMLSKRSFDCIIVDLGLPDMTGFDFLEKIRDHDQMNQIPVIVYTGKDLTREENMKLEQLANTVVLKTAYSHERLLDETTLFLHRVEAKLPKEKQNVIRKLHKTDAVLKNKKVLVVDDDGRNVYSLLSALQLEGLKCCKAGNGKEALKLLQTQADIDLVLMDVMMPEMDGFEATRAIRTLPAYKKIPIIALTAKAMKEDREKCLASGMSDYISKPLNVQQLLSLMRVWLYA